MIIGADSKSYTRLYTSHMGSVWPKFPKIELQRSNTSGRGWRSTRQVAPLLLHPLQRPLAGKYVHRSSKETSRLDAIEVAYEFADSYRSKANSDHAQKKATSFEHYAKKLMGIQKGKSKWSDGDNKLLNRSKDGLICYFGKYDVTKITTGEVRDYLIHLDENRQKRLAESNKAKHTIIIRKVLTLAVEVILPH